MGDTDWGSGGSRPLSWLLYSLHDVLTGHIVVVQTSFVCLPADAEECRSLLEGVRVAALASICLRAGQVTPVGQAFGEHDELAVDPLAEFQRDVADRLEGWAAIRSGDLLHRHRPVGAPAADTEHLVEAVRDELISDPGRVVSTTS